MVEIMRKKIIIPGMLLLACGGFSFLSGQQIEKVQLGELIKEPAGGKFEFSVHYGQWSLNPLQKLFEEEITDAIGDEVRDEVRGQVNALQPGLVAGDFSHSLALSSSGTNFGLELRYYPRGRQGAFSFGLSLDKTQMRMAVSGLLRQDFVSGGYAEVDAEGFIELNPITTNVSVRWDFIPRWIVSPYFVLGVGVAALNGDLGYSYEGSLEWAGPSEPLADNEEKTIQEAEENMDFNIPNIFVLLQMNLGIRVLLLNHLSLHVEAGFWDGIVIRGGLGIRF
jgi:hypothetical protein